MATGGDEWYHVGELHDAAVKELGPEKGRQWFDRFADYMALTSAQMKAPENVRSASVLQMWDRQGVLTPENLRSGKLKFPAGTAPRYPNQAMDEVAEYIENGYRIDPVMKPKKARFAENIKGNYANATIDMHVARGMKMTNAAGKPVDAIPAEGYMKIQKVIEEIAKRHGIEPAQAQSAGWVGGADLTNIGEFSAAPLMQIIERRISKTAKERGQPVAEVLKKWITGQDHLLSTTIFAGLAAGAAAKAKAEQPKPEKPAGVLGDMQRDAVPAPKSGKRSKTIRVKRNKDGQIERLIIEENDGS
jgi:hypothetical protein